MRFLAVFICMVFWGMSAIAGGLDILTITGKGAVQVQADMAQIRLGVETQAKGADAAVNKNAELMQAVLAALQAGGVAKADIQTADFSINQLRDYDRNVVKGYAVRNMLMVRLQDHSKMGAILDAAVKAGANQFHGFSFIASDTDAPSAAALAMAVKNAQERAAVMAAAAGIKLGKLISINDSLSSSPSEGPFMAKALMSDNAQTPIAAGKVSVSAQVQIVFEIIN